MLLEHFAETQTNYPTTNLTIDFADDCVKAIRYDLVTGGNAGAFRMTQDWFDGEGNFIAFENVTRTHLLFCLARVSEYAKSVLYDLLKDQDGIHMMFIHSSTKKLEWNKEAVEFMIDLHSTQLSML